MGRNHLSTVRPAVIITGCSSGIGRAAAFHFARNGWSVVATVREQYQFYSLFAELHQASLHTAVVLCDVTRDDDLQNLVGHAIERFGRIDALINNAGYGQFGGVEVVSPAQARAQLEVNTIAPARLAQLVMPLMREQGGGRIINISSVAGRIVVPWGGWYAASKFALEALTDALRIEGKPFGIRVVSVLAGPVESSFFAKLNIVTPEHLDVPLYNRVHEHALVRRTKPRPSAWASEEVAALLFRIATTRRPRTRYVTGTTGKAALILRKVLPDFLWDKLIVRAYGAHSILNNSPA
ncbi:MAG: SDR family oxidoreductase [bacterium]|nr:SDR family oxidoreductase [bacterium]